MRCILAVAALSLGVMACKLDGPSGPSIDAGPAVDAPVDASAACAACAEDEICVQTFDGTCASLGVTCVTPTTACPAAACTTDCDLALCKGGDPAGILTCAAPSCPDEAPAALHCYGP
ncbi:MAG: hypothetical protein R3B06_01955 [Kofleriaceae bacterium]